MHPAFSVIFFTTLSGAGYGLLFWLGLYGAAGLLAADPIFAIVAMLLTLGAITIGLFSSALHLGHPERAWRAFSQWRSSWLSREGVAATVTYVPALVFWASWLFGLGHMLMVLSGLVSAAMAVVTVICTGYIYRSLKPIPRWHNGWVVPNYLTLAAMTGALLLLMLTDLFGHAIPDLRSIALATIAVAALAKLAYWRSIDSEEPASTPETATGLGKMGKVALLEAPHTSENYLLKEMGYRIARKHAQKLRNIAILIGFVLPLALTLIAFAGSVVAIVCSALAAATALAGVLVERWLFFAEAKHVVTLYYGRTVASAP